MSTRVGIINYGMGNLTSVFNAFRSLEVDALILAKAEDMVHATHVVLPGVGAFGDGMRNLQQGGWVEAMEREIREQGKPFLGICLGMQLLATTGTEHGMHDGLKWIPGVVEKIYPPDPSLRVPHIGWNDVRFTKNEGLYAGLGSAEDFYFVHSYVLKPADASIVSGVCSYGVDFAASIESGNIRATQYHPEKSQKAGLKVLENFARLKA